MNEIKQTPAGMELKVAQFGTGNFLRAFVDEMLDSTNRQGLFNGRVVMIKQVPGVGADTLSRQGGRYHVVLQGRRDGQTVDVLREIETVSACIDPYSDYEAYLALAREASLRFVVSNTTEAGIVYDESDRMDCHPARSFPGRLAQFLYERFRAFNGAADKGVVMLPVELIEDNGRKLRECVLRLCRTWGLESSFSRWLEESCCWCSTLVDRIVSGYSQEEAQKRGLQDRLLAVAEPFGLWVIESDRDLREELPLRQAGEPVVFTKDIRPFRERKVRVLNGAHTSMAPIAYLAGLDTVGACMADPLVRRYILRVIFDEIVPQVPLPREEAEAFAKAVLERFENPFLHHKLLDISLHSLAKWRSRVLPTLRDAYRAQGRLPPGCVFSLAALLAFDTVYDRQDGQAIGHRSDGTPYPIREDGPLLDAAAVTDGESLRRVLQNETLWGEDLTRYDGLARQVETQLADIRTLGARGALEKLLGTEEDFNERDHSDT